MIRAVWKGVRYRARPLARVDLRFVAFSSLRGYRRSWVPADVLTAVTLPVTAMPEQLTTSRLAGIPPITGFYAFIAGTVLVRVHGPQPIAG